MTDLKTTFQNTMTYFAQCMGFADGEFLLSIKKTNVKTLIIFLSVAGVAGVLQVVVGLEPGPLMAFIGVLCLELVTGLAASFVRGERLSSHRWKRFGAKLFVWVCLLSIIHLLRPVFPAVYGFLHTTVVVYVSLEYIISILENLAAITGKSNNVLVHSIREMLGKFIDIKAQNNAEEKTPGGPAA